MQWIDRISAIKERAARLNVSVSRLCRETGWTYSTLYRWEHRTSSPNDRTVTVRLGAIEARLSEMEARVVAATETRRRLDPVRQKPSRAA